MPYGATDWLQWTPAVKEGCHPMGIIVPSDTAYWNITFLWTISGQPKTFSTSIGVLDIDLSPRDGATVVDIAHGWQVSGGGPFANTNYPTTWQMIGIDAMQVVDDEPIIFQNRDGATGTSSEDLPPPNVSLLVKKLTASGGRHNRGRFYFGSAILQNDAVSDAGFITTVFVNAYQTMFDTLYSDIVNDDFVPTLFHSDATAPTPITSFFVESQVATQRRRLR
jgi:hypothetical protein